MEERQNHEFHPNSYSGAASSCSAGDQRPNFPGGVYPNHQQYYNSNMYQQNQHYGHDRQFSNSNNDQFRHSHPQPQQPMNSEHGEPFGGGGGGFRPKRGAAGGGFGSAQSAPFNGRKRGFHHSGPGAPTDQADCGHAKLYVVPIPRTAIVEDIQPLFEQHGKVIEVILYRDKRTGQQQGSCFVKYATFEDAERAIKALNNRHTFSGELGPIKVRLAEGERERLANWQPHQEGGGNGSKANWRPHQEGGGNGSKANWRPHQEGGGNGSKANWRPHQEGGGNGSIASWQPHQEGGGRIMDKLYVRNVNRLASNKDIEEIFSQYGFVENVFIVQDEQKQSRGRAFVKFPRREMALAAVKALNGTFTMRGCDHPLMVCFAAPIKPRTGEPRGNYPFAGPNFGPHSQEPGFRPASAVGDSSGGHIVPNAAYPVQQNHISPNVQSVSQMPNQENAVPVFTQQNPQLHQSPAQLSQMPVHHNDNIDTCSQSSQQTDSETQKQSHIRPSSQKLEKQHILQNTKQESPQNRNDPQATASPLPAVPASPQAAPPLECDWSEHTCPDGDKYYYNCVTCESRWEKPKEFALFDKQLKEQQQLLDPNKPLQSVTPDLSTQEVVQIQQDLDHVKLQSETSPVIGSICVQ